MKIKLFGKDICDDRFYLMVYDTLDDLKEKDIGSIESFAEALKEDINNIIDEVVADWSNENLKEVV